MIYLEIIMIVGILKEIKITDKGWKKACRENKEIALGLNIVDGRIIHQAVAKTIELTHTT